MIYVDLDNTLIDSVGRLRMEMDVANRYGLSDTDYQKGIDFAFEKYGIGSFGYATLFEGCRAIKPELKREILADWQRIVETACFFPDTQEFLAEFKKEELTLLTTGNPDFQRTKIKAHGLEWHFQEIIIVNSPKCRHISPGPRSVFIDDSPREIDEMKTAFPEVFCVLVREVAPWESQKESVLADAKSSDLLSA